MKKTAEENCVCSFCDKKISEVEVMVTTSDDRNLTICGNCIKLCKAVIEEREMKDSPFSRIPGEKYKQPLAPLRPITKIPKGWHIRETELFASTPYVTACSPNNKRHAEFAVLKPLAWWMICNDQKVDVDKLREEITKHLRYVIWQTLDTY